MKVVSIKEFTTIGPREEQQDVVCCRQTDDGAYYLGVFDGHGRDGKEISSSSSEIIKDITRVEFKPEDDVMNRANVLRQMMQKKSREIISRNLRGGTTATVAVIKQSGLAVAYLGDSEAFFYSDDDDATAMTYPHTAHNSAEVERVKKLSYEVKIIGGTKYFGGRLMVSRAIGDSDCKFVSDDAEITSLTIQSKGTLVVGSDGIWGDSHGAVEKAIRSNYFSEGFLKRLAVTNVDNASAIIVRIEN